MLGISISAPAVNRVLTTLEKSLFFLGNYIINEIVKESNMKVRYEYKGLLLEVFKIGISMLPKKMKLP